MRVRIIRSALVSLAICLSATTAYSETIEQAHQSALALYYAADYQRAVDEFERIAAVPMHDPILFYNLGCAYYRLGKLGPAIYSFERSLVLRPKFDDASHNLRVARRRVASRAQDVLKGPSEELWWRNVISVMSIYAWWVCVLTVWWIGFVLIFVLRFVRSDALRASVIATAALLLIGGGVGGLVVGVGSYSKERVREGIVLVDSVEVREGPTSQARTAFKLHAGLKARLQEESSDWVRLRLGNGLEGWVPSNTVGQL